MALSAHAFAAAEEGERSWVDERTCRNCHAEIVARWQASQHARAMQPASGATVLGDFSGGAVAADEPDIRFSRRGDAFSLRAPDASGRMRRFELTHTFGVEPLQQYLVRAGDGRLQALTVAWDTVRRRWFSLYPGATLAPSDPRHWSRPGANWNTMCASCHSGGLRKQYNVETDRYDTRYATVAVGCQSCHGPASAHPATVPGTSAVKDATAAGGGGTSDRAFAPISGRDRDRQVDACAQCHSFRTQLQPEHRHRERFLDQYLPVLLTEGNYFADGQQQGEVFVWGSWLQSRMHQRGLVCSDCHDVHSGKLRATGDALCTSCHRPQGPEAPRVRAGIDFSGLKFKDYTADAHHRHGNTPPGCVDCHAGRRAFMVVDERLDHAFRIPRPDIAERIGSPDPCTSCHKNKNAGWARLAFDRLYPPREKPPPHYGEVFAAARTHAPGAAMGLLAVARDLTQPEIVRATAMQYLRAFPGRQAVRVLGQGTADSDPLVRLGALRGLAGLSSGDQVPLVVAALADPVRSVRLTAAGMLLGRSRELEDTARLALERVLAEYENAQRENADRPEGLINLARLALHRDQADAAERYLRLATTRHRGFVPAHLAIAEALRRRGDEAGAVRELENGLQAARDEPALLEALGQSLVRQRRYADAEALLAPLVKAEKAASTAVLLYANLVAERASLATASAVVEGAITRLGGRRELLLTLASLRARQGLDDGAKAALDQLARINPEDPALQAP